MLGRLHNSEAGFTLLELMISTALLLIIAGATVVALNSSQKRYRQNEVERALHQQMRGAIEMITQEINQAGLVASGMELINGVTSTSAGITNLHTAWATGGAQQIVVNSVTGLFPYENIWVDTGSNAEPATILSISGTTLTLDTTGPNTSGLSSTSGHAVGAPVYPRGIFPAGILPPNTTNGSTPSSLRLLGDIQNNGTLEYVQYDCPQTGSNTTNSLVRSTWSLQSASWTSNKVALLDNVTKCVFIYTYTANVTRSADPNSPPDVVLNAPDDPNGSASTTQSNRFTLTDGTSLPQFVISVGITLTSCSQSNTTENTYMVNGLAPICLTKSFLNIQPRNVLAGYLQAVQIYNSDQADTPPDIAYEKLLLNLQPTPTSLLPTSNP